MKLCYHKLGNGLKNFGDDLNPWMWDKLITGILDDDVSVAFVGIGTLLNDRLNSRTRFARRRIVFGTGAGYGTNNLKLDNSYKIYCVRGPLSAKCLGIEESAAVTDGAVLIRDLFSQETRKKYQFSYMPHYELAGEGWACACREIGFGYIDPRWAVEDVLKALGQTEVLLSEAMHGAIVADSLRIPWIPIISSDTILSFKWQDWCSSIDTEYKPVHIERLHHPRNNVDLLTPVRLVRDKNRQRKAGMALKKIAMSERPNLSKASRIESLNSQLKERLHQFQEDVEKGFI